MPEFRLDEEAEVLRCIGCCDCSCCLSCSVFVRPDPKLPLPMRDVKREGPAAEMVVVGEGGALLLAAMALEVPMGLESST